MNRNGICIDYILLCETFLSDNICNQFNIPGYSLISNNRTRTSRGGVAIYVHNKYNFRVRSDLSTFIEGEFGSIFVEIEHNKQHAIVGEVYRIPNYNLVISLQRYESILLMLQNYQHCIILGTDQNIGLLKLESHEPTRECLNMFYSNNLIPTTTKPTRMPIHLLHS